MRQEGRNTREGQTRPSHPTAYPHIRSGPPAELKGKKRVGAGVVSKEYALTALYYVYRMAFRSHDNPKLRASYWIPSFPHSEREIWVKQRQIRDLLLAIEPGARWEKHEARRCPRCHRWVVGIQAQMMREREQRARLKGEASPPCSDYCEARSGLTLKNLRRLLAPKAPES